MILQGLKKLSEKPAAFIKRQIASLLLSRCTVNMAWILYYIIRETTKPTMPSVIQTCIAEMDIVFTIVAWLFSEKWCN